MSELYAHRGCGEALTKMRWRVIHRLSRKNFLNVFLCLQRKMGRRSYSICFLQNNDRLSKGLRVFVCLRVASQAWRRVGRRERSQEHLLSSVSSFHINLSWNRHCAHGSDLLNLPPFILGNGSGHSNPPLISSH